MSTRRWSQDGWDRSQLHKLTIRAIITLSTSAAPLTCITFTTRFTLDSWNSTVRITNRNSRSVTTVNQDRWRMTGMKSRRQLTLGSVTQEENLTIRLDGKVINRVRIYGSTAMRSIKKWSLNCGKKKNWSQPAKEEGALEVVQGLDRGERHIQRFKLKEPQSCGASWEPPQYSSQNLLQTSYWICLWKAKGQVRTSILPRETEKYSKWESGMNYNDFVVFLFSYLCYYFHIVTIQRQYCHFQLWDSCIIKAVR